MNIDWLLIKKSSKGKLTEEEKRTFDDWLSSSEEHSVFYNNVLSFERSGLSGDTANDRKILEQKFDAIDRRRKALRIRRYSIGAVSVAAVLIALIIMIPSLQPNRPTQSDVSEMISSTGGEKKAILIIDEKEVIELDRTNSLITNEVSVMKLSKTKITQEKELDQIINRLVTPRGCEYSIQLSDGTVVWLNASSELIYPEKFSGDVRRVQLKGEAYFEVTKEKTQFIVSTDGMDIKVYGTEFNVNTRNPEAITTILVEGKIAVDCLGAAGTMLSPSQMAQYNKKTHKMEVKSVDVNQYIAWRNREYKFENTPLREILEELSLWYNFDYEFERESLGDIQFTIYVPRSEDIANIINYLEKTGHVTIQMTGKKLIIQ